MIILLLGMGLVTYLPRMLPLVILSKLELPPIILKWLKFIPSAVLSALLAPEIFMPGGRFSVGLDNKPLLASIPCFLVAYKTRNLFATVTAGIISMFLLQLLF